MHHRHLAVGGLVDHARRLHELVLQVPDLGAEPGQPAEGGVEGSPQRRIDEVVDPGMGDTDDEPVDLPVRVGIT